MNTYDVGDLVRLRAVFKNAAGADTDPTTIVLKHKNPAGTVTTLTYSLAELTKEGTGIYYKDVSITLDGKWIYKFIATGTVQAVEEEQFFVRKSEIA